MTLGKLLIGLTQSLHLGFLRPGAASEAACLLGTLHKSERTVLCIQLACQAFILMSPSLSLLPFLLFFLPAPALAPGSLQRGDLRCCREIQAGRPAEEGDICASPGRSPVPPLLSLPTTPLKYPRLVFLGNDSQPEIDNRGERANK